MLADAQANYGISCAHVQWFSHQKIKADDCDGAQNDITVISLAILGGNYKRRAHTNLRAVIWAFWY